MIPRIQSVQIRNYKSLADVRLELPPLTILVGPNGAGKSNFLDALSFVQQCLVDSIELAFKSRGGIGAVRRRSGGHPTHVGIRLVLCLDSNTWADYSFEIAAKQKERFRVARERCIVQEFMGTTHRFEIRDGVFSQEIPGIRPRLSPDRLALFAASATEEFRPVFNFLTSMRFYSIAPGRLRELQEPGSGDFLKPDGSNAAAVLKRVAEQRPRESYERLCRLLSRVVAGIEQVEYHSVGSMETIQFKQDIGLKDPWRFDASNMSDGTLRVLGLLLAIYQTGETSVVGIEEPEATVHPGVAELVVQVLEDAANRQQVLVTTHSPDLLDYNTLSDKQIRPVIMERGRTLVAPLDAKSRDAIRERLYTPGELLRDGELEPDVELARAAAQNLNLFGSPEPPRPEDADETSDRGDR